MIEKTIEILHESNRGQELGGSVKDMLSAGGEGLSWKEYISCWRDMGIGLGRGLVSRFHPGTEPCKG